MPVSIAYWYTNTMTIAAPEHIHIWVQRYQPQPILEIFESTPTGTPLTIHNVLYRVSVRCTFTFVRDGVPVRVHRLRETPDLRPT